MLLHWPLHAPNVFIDRYQGVYDEGHALEDDGPEGLLLH